MTEPTVRPGANAESSPLNLRAPHDVIAQLARVASKLPPGLFTRHKLAVIALEHGLAVIERDPSILLRGPSGAVLASARAPASDANELSKATLEKPLRTPAEEREFLAVEWERQRQELDQERDELSARKRRIRERMDLLNREHSANTPVVDPRQLAIPGAIAITAPVSEPAAAPRRARAEAVATPENDALRARYCAALAAKRLTNEATAKLVGCSEATLRQWKNGAIKNLGGDKDPDGKWLAALTRILDALPHPLE